MELILWLRRCSFSAFLATLSTEKLRTRKHSSRMHTAHFSGWGVCPFPLEADLPPRGRPSLRQPPIWRQIPQGRHPPWTEWQTRVKTLSCPKLRLRAVMMETDIFWGCCNSVRNYHSSLPLNPTGSKVGKHLLQTWSVLRKKTEEDLLFSFQVKTEEDSLLACMGSYVYWHEGNLLNCHYKILINYTDTPEADVSMFAIWSDLYFEQLIFHKISDVRRDYCLQQFM